MKKNLLIASNNLADAKGIEGVFCNLDEIQLLPSVFSGRETIDTILAQDVELVEALEKDLKERVNQEIEKALEPIRDQIAAGVVTAHGLTIAPRTAVITIQRERHGIQNSRFSRTV